MNRFIRNAAVIFACSSPSITYANAVEDAKVMDAMTKLHESKLDVSLLNDEKKASINLAASSGFLRYAFNVEQRFESGQPNITFASRDGIAAKTKATILASYKIIDPMKSNSTPAPAVGQGVVITDPSLNPLSDFGVIDFSFSHFRSDVGYYSLDEAKKISVRKDGFEGALGGSWINSIDQTRIAVGLTYQRGYERERSNKEKNICRNLPDTPGFTECFNAYLAPAKKVEKFIPYFRFIHVLDDSFITSYELYVKYISTREPDSEVEETKGNVVFEAPIHIWSLLDKKLSAGVKFAYATKPGAGEDKFAYGIFLSAPLSVY